MEKGYTHFRKTPILLASLAALITFLVYLPALKNGFVNWDDDIYLNEIVSLGTGSGFLKSFTDVPPHSYWHPVTLISYLVDYALWGQAPWGYHLVNIIFHASNTFLVFVLTLSLFRHSASRLSEFSALTAASVASLLFALHPLHVESVAWVAERKDMLYAFFFILSILAYLEYAAAASRRRWPLYAASLIFFILSLMSKPMAVTLPFVLIIMDVYPLERTRGVNPKKLILEKVPFFIMSGLSIAMTVFLQKGTIPRQGFFPLPIRVVTALRSFIFYLYKMLLPFDLAPYYPYPEKISLFSLEYAGSALFFIAISLFCIFTLKKAKIFSAAWLFYIITLIPVIGLVQVGGQEAADRYTYFSSLGPFLLAGVASGLLVQRGGRGAFVLLSLCGAIAFFLAYMTISQIGVWKDSVTMWSYEIRFLEKAPEISGDDTDGYSRDSVPRAAVAYYSRAMAYNQLGNYDLAIKDLNKVVSLGPKFSRAYLNRGVDYGKVGNLEMAAADFKKAIELNPEYAPAYLNLGMIYSRAGDNAKAAVFLKKASDLGLKEPDGYQNR